MGGSANYGQSKQSSGSQATSSNDGYGYNLTGNQATSGQSVYGAQQPGLGAVYGGAQGLATGSSPYSAGVQGVTDAGTAAWQQQLQPGSNPFFDQSVQASIDQATDSFKRQVLPELDSRGVGAGQYGSSRDQLARGEAAGEFGAGLAQSVAQQRATQYSGDQTRALGAVGLTPQMQAGQIAPLSLAASLLGGPTVLGQSQSSGFGMGENTTHGESQATSRGKGSSINMGASAGAKG